MRKAGKYFSLFDEIFFQEMKYMPPQPHPGVQHNGHPGLPQHPWAGIHGGLHGADPWANLHSGHYGLHPAHSASAASLPQE